MLTPTRVYIAAPLFTHAEWRWNRELAAELRRRGFEIILPQERDLPMLNGEEKFDAGALFQENVNGIDRSNVLLAVLDGPDPDSGTCWEIGYAFKAGRPIIGLRTDLRAGGDDGTTAVNLMLSQSCTQLVVIQRATRDDLTIVGERVAAAIRATVPAA